MLEDFLQGLPDTVARSGIGSARGSQEALACARLMRLLGRRHVDSLYCATVSRRYRSTAFRGLPPSLPFALDAAFFALLLDRPPS